MRTARRIHPVLLAVLFSLLFVLLSQAMFATVLTSAHPVARVTRKVDNNNRIILHGHVPTAIQKATDLGRLPGNTPMKHVIMVLKADPEQEHQLRVVIDQQQDKNTANFHQWVTPEEFGEHFGVHDSDVEQVKNWLTSLGLAIDMVSKGKRYLQFSGASAQVEKAFNIEMHYYQTRNGATHVSLDRDISIPEALAPVIRSVPTLHDFFKKSYIDKPEDKPDTMKPNDLIMGKIIRPGFTSGSTHDVGANDFATIYNTAPLLNAGYNGKGVTIAIIGRTDVLLSDMQAYKQIFNLPNNDPNFIVPGEDPGFLTGDEPESDLDLEISSGIAPQATIDFVSSRITLTVDGVDLSASYAVENNLADIISESYGECEADLEANSFYQVMWEQAAAQGTSVFVSSGDSGPASCDSDSDTFETYGYAVSGLASTPFNVAVGGTMFAEGAGTFWSASNNSDLGSALSYIPETPWAQGRVVADGSGISSYYQTPSWQRGPGVPSSDPALTQGGDWVTGVTITNGGSGYTSAPTVTFTGGGCVNEPNATAVVSSGAVTGVTFNYYPSTGQGIGCTSVPTVAFAAPTSGTTATGTASIGQMQDPIPVVPGPHRYMPDVSLNAASSHDPTIYCSEGDCEINSSGGFITAGAVGGTSVAAPSMAGIQALVNQYNGGRQGIPGYYYYGLAAAQNTASCASQVSPLPAANCVFNDIVNGNNFVCGTSGCSSSAGVQMGFTAGTGFDLATGLGSVDAYNLATKWNTITFSSSVTTLSLGQTTGISHGSGVSVTVNVTGASGTPTGDVAFIASQGTLGNVIDPSTSVWVNLPAYGTLSGGTYSGTISDLPAGSYNVVARYAGDGTFGSSTSAPIQVTVTAENSTITVSPNYFNGATCIENPQSTFNYGDYIWVDATVRGLSGQGLPTGSVTIYDNSTAIATSNLNNNGVAHILAGPVATSNCLYGYTAEDVTTFTGGTHNLTASYAGDGTFNASTTTGPVAVTVNPLALTLTLSAGATQISSGSADQLVASLTSPFSGVLSLTAGPTGTVTFADATTSTTLGTASLVSNNLLNAQATLSTTGITTSGANSITASYSGDTNYAPAPAVPVSVTVGTGATSTTAVTSSGNPTTLNGRPTFTATVTAVPAVTTGTVTFYDGTTLLGTGTVGTAHTATFKIASASLNFVAGTHNITATFSGISGVLASTSPVFPETVNKSTPTVTDLTVKSLGSTGQNFAFSCLLGSPTANYPYQAGVQFYDGGNPLGSPQPLPAAASSPRDGELTTTLSAGTHTITCQYVGDSNYNASALSNAQVVNVETTSLGIYSPTSGSTLPGSTATFQWFAAATSYWVDIGKEQGGDEYYQSGPLSNIVLSVTPTTLPTDGSTVWVRWYYFTATSSWKYIDYTYTALNAGADKAAMSSPTNGSSLCSNNVPFTWTPASPTPYAYWIDVGSTAGGNNYYQSGSLSSSTTSLTVSGLPTNGSEIFVTLYTEVSNSPATWENNAYTFYATNLSTVTSPANNDPDLSGTQATFNWTNSNPSCSDTYWIDIGTTPGGNNIWQSGNLGNVFTAQNPASSPLPDTNPGTTIYLTLYTINGGNVVGYTQDSYVSGP